MDEDKSNENKNDHPNEEQESTDETKVEYREISKEELKQILEDHKKWVESDGKEGEQADLSGANLQEADLWGANLQMAQLNYTILKKAHLNRANLQEAMISGSDLTDANLQKANLQKANFFDTNLQRANLYQANLQKAHLDQSDLREAYLFDANLNGADLVYANLQKADINKSNMQNTALEKVIGLNEVEDLQYANFEGATGLLGNEFAQADVTGTTLPDGIKDFKALDIVEKTSENARKIFFAMLLGCVYSWLTIATTTDVRLLTNSASSPLPIIRTEIPIAWFYIAAPLILICIYFYFHLYLIKLWEALSGLPAIFPDGKRLDERAYPWLLNGLVRRHFSILKTGRPFIAHVQEWITIFLAWCVVPITMMAFWLRYIPRHDWIGTCFHIGLIVFSVAFAIIFYRLCAYILKGKKKVDFRLQNFWRDKRFYYSVCVFLVGFLFLLLSYGTIEGVRSEKPNFKDINKLVPWVFDKIGYDVFADFREKVVSEIPLNYSQIAKEERLEFVKGASLKGSNLKWADMYRAFLVKADLRGALLNYAFLNEANLQQAILVGANLQQAILVGANLQQAILEEVNLQQAKLGGANLQQAKLWQTNLQQADLEGANLQQAHLEYAYLQQAHLEYANLQQAHLEGANLQEADLKEANLQQGHLENAYLQQADLWGAILQKASFNNADLTGAKSLTIEQLSQVKSLYKAKLDPELLEQVIKCCPHLLEKQKDEKDKMDKTE